MEGPYVRDGACGGDDSSEFVLPANIVYCAGCNSVNCTCTVTASPFVQCASPRQATRALVVATTEAVPELLLEIPADVPYRALINFAVPSDYFTSSIGANKIYALVTPCACKAGSYILTSLANIVSEGAVDDEDDDEK